MAFDNGKYRFRVESQGFGKNNSGSTHFFLYGRPMAFIHPDGNEYACDDKPRTIKLTVSEKSAPHVRKKLEAIGWQPDQAWSNLNPNSQVHHSFVGIDIVAECTLTQGQTPGRWFDNWDLPYEGEPMVNDPGLASELDAMFGRGGSPQRAPAAAPAARAQQRAPINAPSSAPQDFESHPADDDIPF